MTDKNIRLKVFVNKSNSQRVVFLPKKEFSDGFPDFIDIKKKNSRRDK